MPSLTERSAASGCGRRVSLKRRTSAACVASRKISDGWRRGMRLSRRHTVGNCDRNVPSRTSATIATFCRSVPCCSDNCASVGINIVGRLSTQKYPRSSSARIAWDLPDPDSPVITTKRPLPLVPPGRPEGRGRAPDRPPILLPLQRVVLVSGAGRIVRIGVAELLIEASGEGPPRVKAAQSQELVPRRDLHQRGDAGLV